MTEPQWKARKLYPHPSCTWLMFEVLNALAQSLETGFPFVHLDSVDKRTIRALIQRDWIVESEGLDGIAYKITGRGEIARQAYSEPHRYRYDGLCPDCGKRERAVSSTGTVYGYCWECKHIRDNATYESNGNRLNPDKPCSRCKKRPRHVYPSGHIIAYCKPCREKMRKDERQRKRRRLLKKLRMGEFVPCIKCGKRSRRVCGTCVYDYCEPCHKAYMKQYHARRAFERATKDVAL